MKLYGTFLNFFGFLVAFSIVSLTLAGQIPTPSYELCILQKIDELRGCDVYFPDKKMSVPESSVQHMCSGIQKKLRCEFEVLLHSCGEKATRSIIKHQKIQIPPKQTKASFLTLLVYFFLTR
ncbi:hypothetical protein DdX_10661 [Ditylenchus destructor]|uniref:Uncharacterized protein n=1 Tax=Ditylenchus destructor TaxID=166010 RepID=A0AAD4R5B4_9BILA|nr:hypothetical protein DdX_10661 [Ditylenchus destructor]